MNQARGRKFWDALGSNEKELLKGMLRSGRDVVGTIGSSLLAEPVAGIGGLGQLILSGGDTAKAAQMVNQIRDHLTYQPEDPGSQRTLELIAKPFEWIEENAIRPASDKAYELGGPLAGAMVNATLNVADPTPVTRALRRAKPAVHELPRLTDLLRAEKELPQVVDATLEEFAAARAEAARLRAQPLPDLNELARQRGWRGEGDPHEWLDPDEFEQFFGEGSAAPQFTPDAGNEAPRLRPVSDADAGSWEPKITPYGNAEHQAKVEAFIAGLRGNQGAFVNPLAPDPSLRTIEEIAAHYSRPGRQVKVERTTEGPFDEPRYIEKEKELPDEPGVFEEVKVVNPDWYPVEGLELTGPKGGTLYYNADTMELDALDARGINPDTVPEADMNIGGRAIPDSDAGLLYQVMNSYALANNLELPSGALSRDNQYRLIGNQLASYARHGVQPRRMGKVENRSNLPINKDATLGGYDLMALDDAATRRRLGKDMPVEFTGEGFSILGNEPTSDLSAINEQIRTLSPQLSATLAGPKSLARSAVYEWLSKPEVTISDAARTGKNWKLGPILAAQGDATPAEILKRKLRETAFNALTQQGESDGTE